MALGVNDLIQSTMYMVIGYSLHSFLQPLEENYVLLLRYIIHAVQHGFPPDMYMAQWIYLSLMIKEVLRTVSCYIFHLPVFILFFLGSFTCITKA